MPRRKPPNNPDGLDVETQEEVDAAYQVALANAETWKVRKITKPALQHGAYSFYF